MKQIKVVLSNPIRMTRIKKRRIKINLKRQMLLIKVALMQEKAETKEMLKTYRKYSVGQANKEEMRMANEQFFDVN